VIVPADVCSKYELETEFLVGLRDHRPQKYLARMASLWKLFKEYQDVFNNEFRSQFEHPPIENWGKDVTQSDLDEFDHFRMHMMMLCNMHNLTDAPNEQLHFFTKMLKWAKDNDTWYAKSFLDRMERHGLKGVLVSDAFVIYAIENPDLVKKEKVTVSCDEGGVMSVKPGGRHTLVTDVDYRHFDNYLKKRLREKPRPKIKRKIR
jgi:hypothetical protein